jgi:hypothetical protein
MLTSLRRGIDRLGASRLGQSRRSPPRKFVIPLAYALMSALAMFALKAPSPLAFEPRRHDDNLHVLDRMVNADQGARRRADQEVQRSSSGYQTVADADNGAWRAAHFGIFNYFSSQTPSSLSDNTKEWEFGKSHHVPGRCSERALFIARLRLTRATRTAGSCQKVGAG